MVEKFESRPEAINETEEEIDDGMGVLAKRKIIYHGSAISGIEKFNLAEEDTVGNGVYFTSDKESAAGYARSRSKGEKGATPMIYQCEVENMKLLDLRKEENVKKVMSGFREILSARLNSGEKLGWNIEGVLREAIDNIDRGNIGVGKLKIVTFHFGGQFTEYVRSLGYEGLITFEGGEGNEVGDHDTYLVFDPEKIKVKEECKVE